MLSSIQTNIIEPFLVLRQSMAPLKLSRWQLTRLVVTTALDGLPDGSLFVLLAALGATIILLYLRFNKKHVSVPPGLAVVKRNHAHYLDIIKEGRELVCAPYTFQKNPPGTNVIYAVCLSSDNE